MSESYIGKPIGTRVVPRTVDDLVRQDSGGVRRE